MKSFFVYLAGPISGLGFNESIDWRQYAIENLDSHISGVSPLRGKEYLGTLDKIVGSYDNNDWPLSTQRGIYTRDNFDVHRSDLLLVNLLNATTVSIGTVMEIAWAKQANIPIVLIMEPHGNIHEHPMLLEACPFVVSDIDTAIVLTNHILMPTGH